MAGILWVTIPELWYVRVCMRRHVHMHVLGWWDTNVPGSLPAAGGSLKSDTKNHAVLRDIGFPARPKSSNLTNTSGTQLRIQNQALRERTMQEVRDTC